MASKNLLYIIPRSVVFNYNEVPVFESLSQKDSSFLSSSLYLNQNEVVQKLSGTVDIHLGIDERDKNFIPAALENETFHKHFINSTEYLEYYSRIFSSLPHTGFPNIIMLLSNTIGIRQSDFIRAFNLLNHDDNNIIIGKSASGTIVFLGFNYFNEKLFEGLTLSDFTNGNIINRINGLDYFLFIFDGFYSIDNLNDFKNLYKILSTKESIEYCSSEMHEQFTHLFIEYKEIL
jgi:hypothetical protein